MSHVDQGPLSAYNSLTDDHLAGFFSNTQMRRHLRKSGLVTKRGEVVTENTYRLNMARKEHKKHVKNMLAQAIVHKTLDLERSRQSEIRKKIEEIAKIELVRRVKASRDMKRENYVLPLVSPKGASRPSSSSTNSNVRSKGKYRPMRPKSSPSRKVRRPFSALSSNYDDDSETVVYLDDEGRPISPSHIDEQELRYSTKDPIDTHHLYSLDTTALRKYAMLMAQMDQGKDGLASPYLVPQVPIPPKSPHHGGTPRSANRYRVDAARLESPKRPTTADQAYLHPSGTAKHFRGQQQSLCEVFMIYHGQSLSLAREQLDRRQDVLVEQQHCGGNTLVIFRDKMEPNTEFSFISYRHCGYPFAMSIYIDGKIDCRISTCCEYRHSKGRRISGKNGHFSFKTITGCRPCYKCQVEKGIRVKSTARRPKLKRPPQHQEEVVVVETKDEPAEQKPVESDDAYEDEDFEDSEVEEGFLNFQPKEARGVDKTTGKADINYVSDEDADEDDDADWGARFSQSPNANEDGRKTSHGHRVNRGIDDDEEEETMVRPLSPVPSPIGVTDEEDKPAKRRDSVSSASSAASLSSSSSTSSKEGGSSDDYSDSKEDKTEKKKPEGIIVSMERGQHDSGNEGQAVEIPVGSTDEGALHDGGDKVETTPIETAVEKDDDVPKNEKIEEAQSGGFHKLDSRDDKERNEDSDDSYPLKLAAIPSIVGVDIENDVVKDERKVNNENYVKEENDENNIKGEINIKDEIDVKDENVVKEEIRLTSKTPSAEDEPKKRRDSVSSAGSTSSTSSKEAESSDDSKSKKQEAATKREAEIKTTAIVHSTESGRKLSYGTYEEAESDPEATHGGNDPDNVANDNVITVSRTIDPVPLGDSRPGSVLPLLESNKNAVELKSVTLNKTQVYEVAEYLERSAKLSPISLVNCGIDDDDVQKLMEALRVSPSNPVMVNLSLNPLTSSSVNHILKTVNIKNSIEAVLLQGTRLGDDGVNALVDGIMAHYESIKDNPELKEKGLHELDLSDCKFGDEGVVAIARLLKSQMDIDTVTLSYNHAISLEGWKTIAESLKENRSLETLTLDHNFIGDEGILAITEALQNNTSVTALDLNDVGMTDKGGRAIMDMLKKNTSILEIVMMDNKISDSISESIQKYISLNKANYSQ